MSSSAVQSTSGSLPIEGYTNEKGSILTTPLSDEEKEILNELSSLEAAAAIVVKYLTSPGYTEASPTDISPEIQYAIMELATMIELTDA